MPTAPGCCRARRRLLGLGMMTAATVLVPAAAFPAPPRGRSGRILSFLHTHTGEHVTATYQLDGVYQPAALRQIDRLLRDFRTDQVRPIDCALLDLLHDLHEALGTGEPFHVISGYRSPATNAMLRAQGGARSGVASGSLHMAGKAIDIRIPGVPLDRLRTAALSLMRGGVGYYPAPGFVHVDTGRVRYW